MPRLQTPVVMVVLPTPAVAELFVFASLAALTAGQRRSVGDDTSAVLRLRLAGLWEDHGLVFLRAPVLPYQAAISTVRSRRS